MLRLQLGLIGLCLAALPSQTHAATIRVPEDYPSVLAAVDAAVAGDSVLVGPGTWSDVETRQVPIFGVPQTVTACAFLKSGLTLVGAGAAATTIEQGGVGSGRVALIYASQEGAPVRMEGMTIMGGTAALGFLGSIAGGVEIRHCVIRECDPHAIDVQYCDVLLEDVALVENSAEVVLDSSDSDLELRRCEFVANPGRSIRAGEISGGPIVAHMEECRLEETGGVSFFAFSEVEVLRNVFTSCTTSHPVLTVSQGNGFAMQGAVAYNGFDRVSVTNAFTPGCVDIDGISGEVAHNTWSGCTSDQYLTAGRVYLEDGGSFRNNVIAGCVGATAIEVLGFQGAVIDVGCNDFWDNPDGDYTQGYPGTQDFFADPLFCDPESGDLELQSASVCAEENNAVCGQIGAYGIGCGTVSIQRESWGGIKAKYREGDGS
jgi:hypothetical protein